MATRTASRPARTASASRPVHVFTGTWTLVRFILRRDRVRLAIWIGAIALFIFLLATSFPELYPTEAGRQARGDLMSNPTGIAFTGPGHGLDDYTFGAMLANEMLGMTSVALALMAIFGVVRHTRNEEETGRTELLRATVLGRHADTAAAIAVYAVASVAVGAVLALLLPASGAGLEVGSSILFSASLASVGVVFAAVGGFCAQVTQHSRGASGIGGIVLGLVFTLRAAGDVGENALSWLSPIGWAQATRSYVDDRWWPLGLSLVTFGLVSVAAVLLSDKRDLGAGLVPPRRGQGNASSFLVRPFGLAVRLQRGAAIAWGLGLFAFGLMYGSFLDQVEDFAAENEFVQEWLVEAGGATFTESFAAQLALIMAMLASGFAIQSMLRPRSEETGGRAEPVLATALGRISWVCGHLVISLAGAAVVLLLAGLGLGISAAAVTGEGSWIPRMLGAHAVHVPAVWILAGLALALYGNIPRLVGLAWAVLAWGVAIGFFGALLGLPSWLIELTPFGHVPQVPAADFALLPVLAMAAVAALLVATGLAGIRNRDLAAGA